jgi:hypothetical protein
VPENIGGINVSIAADAGPAIAQFAKAQAAAQSAGAGIAAGLNQGSAGADKMVIAIGMLARVIQEESAAATLAAQRNLALAGSLIEAGSAGRAAGASIAAGANQASQAMAGSTNQARLLGSELRVLSGRGGVLAAERFLIGIPGVAAFSNLIFPALGLAAVVELLSSRFGKLSEEEKKTAEESKKLSEEWEHLAVSFEHGEVERAALEVGKLSSLKLEQFYDDGKAGRDRANLKSLQQEIQAAWAAMRTDAATAALSSNPAVATAQLLNPAVTVNRLMATQDWNIQAEKAKELGKQIGLVTEKLKLYDDVTSKVEADRIKQVKASEEGSRQGKVLDSQVAQLEAVARVSATMAEIQEGHQHAIVQASIDAMKDRIAAVVAEAQEELRVAQQKESRITADLASHIAERKRLIEQQGAAELLGKTPEEVPAIQAATRGKVAAMEAEEGQKVLDAHKATAAAEDRVEEALGTSIREHRKKALDDSLEDLRISGEEQKALLLQQAEETRKETEAKKRESDLQLRLSQVGIRQTGVQAEGAAATDRLQTQLVYAQQIVHSKADEFSQAQALAAIDARELEIKAGQARMELAAAIIANDRLSDEQSRMKVKEDELALDEALAKVQEGQLKTAVQLTDLKIKQSNSAQLEIGLAKNIESIAGTVGSAIATGITEQHQKHHNIGQDIADGIVKGLRGTAQKALSDVFTFALEEAIKASGVASAARKLGGVIFGTPATATAPATGGVLGGILGKLGGILGIPPPGATIGQPGVPVGGAGSGPLSTASAAARQSAMMQQILTTEDQIEGTLVEILAAIQRGADCSCRGAQEAKGSGGGILGKLNDVFNIAADAIGIGSFIGSLGQKAGGGSVSAHTPYIVGEKRPELFVPDVPGTILPSVPTGGAIGSNNFSSTMSVNSASNSIGQLAIHLHGVRDMEDVARRLPGVLKPYSPAFSPASS